MNFEPIQISILAGSWGFVTGGLWKLFERVEKVASDDAKKATSDWLMSVDINTHFSTWATTFRYAFESVFGSQLPDNRFLSRSALASILSVLLVLTVWAAFRSDDMLTVARSNDFGPAFSLLLGMFSWNVILDIFSLLESRYVILLMSRSTSALRTIALLFLDAALTTAIALSPYGLLRVAVGKSGIFEDQWFSILVGMELYLSNGIYFVPGIFFYSTFFTSVWVWLYAVSGLLLRISKSVVVLISFLDIKHQPFLCIGVISILVVSILYLVGGAVLLGVF